MLSVGIITAPRVPYYLGVSLGSYFRSWDITPHVFAEQDTITNFSHSNRVILHRNEANYGCVYNWLQAITWMYHNTSTPYIMMCEDDISWIAGTSSSLRTILMQGYVNTPRECVHLKKAGYISPYCSMRNRSEMDERDTWIVAKFKQRSWCGALAICFTREMVKNILDRSTEFIYYSAHKSWDKRILHLDYAIGKMVDERPIITHNPTGVLHIGEISTAETNNEAKLVRSRMPAL